MRRKERPLNARVDAHVWCQADAGGTVTNKKFPFTHLEIAGYRSARRSAQYQSHARLTSDAEYARCIEGVTTVGVAPERFTCGDIGLSRDRVRVRHPSRQPC